MGWAYFHTFYSPARRSNEGKKNGIREEGREGRGGGYDPCDPLGLVGPPADPWDPLGPSL
eukprot:7388876-Prymnesium_polylepis.1